MVPLPVVMLAIVTTMGQVESSGELVALERVLVSEVQPLVARYCHDCHSDDRVEADLDFAKLASWADARRRPEVWQRVRDMLDSDQMPPPEAKQPTDAERLMLRSWVRNYLKHEAQARAGDPGPVVLRRLTNAEYEFAVRDLTGIEALEPTREFPVDGAAGEGFTNTGAAQGMSPALAQKYLDAAKSVASHVVLLPDGVRFSRFETARDRTDELLAQIQAFYRQFTEDGGGSAVDLQGIKFDTNQGGLLPIRDYLAATIAARDPLRNRTTDIESVAREAGLNPRYLDHLWRSLTDGLPADQGLLLGPLRSRWQTATMENVPFLAAEIAQWQKSLWRFNSVGHIGREGGPTAWLEPVSPVTARHDLRRRLGGESVVLVANDLGDSNVDDVVIWERPRIEFPASQSSPGYPPILLRDLRMVSQRVVQTFERETVRTVDYLDAVARIHATSESAESQSAKTEAVESEAKRRGLNARLLAAWTDFLRLGKHLDREVAGHFSQRLTGVHGFPDVNGWGESGTPSLLTNRSKAPIRLLTLTVPARGVTVHPSPALDAVVAWQSSFSGSVRWQGRVADADDQCGNGAAWRMELRSETGSKVLASGQFENGKSSEIRPDSELKLNKGDVLSLVIIARDRDHSCDTTHVELTLTEVSGDQRKWDLATDIIDRVLDANPLPDSYGNPRTWHFCAASSSPTTDFELLAGTVLADWRAAVIRSLAAGEIRSLAQRVQDLVTTTNEDRLTPLERNLRQRLRDWRGPLKWIAASEQVNVGVESGDVGVAAAHFGRRPNGTPVDPDSLCLQAPHVLEIRLPASLVAGGELVVSGILDDQAGQEGSVQLQLLDAPPDSRRAASSSEPILVRSGSPAEQRIKAGLAAYRELFPPALCYARIVPVDEVVTLTLFHREDHHLQRLMLNASQTADLNRLWDELYFVSREPLNLVVVFEQLAEFATQDRPDLVKAFAPLKQPIADRAIAFRKKMAEAEPTHLQAVVECAERAWRRNLTDDERHRLQQFYQQLRRAEVAHEDSIQLTLARVLASPDFLYRRELPVDGRGPGRVSDMELASRLSFFLWSSIPDDELRVVAAAGRLIEAEKIRRIDAPADPREIVRQTRRMLRDAKSQRLAIHFACQWLNVRDFDRLVEKNETLYPQFAGLRGDMYQEVIQFFEDLFRNDGSILACLDADYTFVNLALASHYGMTGLSGDEWQRVSGTQSAGRGGLLGMAAVLASQSGVSRSSPILRGNWVYETLLGERLPRPPAGVPVLPEEVPAGLTDRQLIEQHSSVAACAKCHVKIDPFGFALEQFDTIGRLRSEAVDVRARLANGSQIEGIAGLRQYLTNERRDDFVRHFCRKLLGYALGREIQLSDEPLLDEMALKLAQNGFRTHVAVETIVLSAPFQTVRGREFEPDSR